MKNTNSASCFLGTSGLLLPVPNKLHYPPEFKDGSRLTYYASLMNSIEINSSFYKIPQEKTVVKWSDEVGESFRFTFKLFKEITHQPQLTFNWQTLERFMTVINGVGDKSGSLLVQFPPSVKISLFKQLQYLLEALRQLDAIKLWKIAVEFRDPSWYIDEVTELLMELDMGLVLHDKGVATTPILDLPSSFVYLRFHGPDGNYKGSYEEGLLAEYADYISDWINEGKDVYCYFNNTAGEAIANLETLRKYIAEIKG